MQQKSRKNRESRNQISPPLGENLGGGENKDTQTKFKN